ncbi:MAG TPA: zf-HC2 domain-containing protein [bacterium]|jgi:hypothetical protein
MKPSESEPLCTDLSLGSLLLPYALGTLDEPSAQRFEDHVLTCTACRDELTQAAKSLQTLSANRMTIVQRLQENIVKQTAPSRRPSRVTWLLAAALGLAAIVAILLLVNPLSDHKAPDKPQVAQQQPPPADTAAQQPATDPEAARWAAVATTAKLPFAISTPRGDGDPKEERFQQAMQPYVAGDMPAAETQLQRLSKEMPDKPEVWLYLASSAYLNNHLDLAAAAVRQGLSMDPRSTRKAEFRWLRANLELKKGNASQAQAWLHIILKDNTAMLTESQDLLNKIQAAAQTP